MTCLRKTNYLLLAACLLCLGLDTQSAQSAEVLNYPVHLLERAPVLDGKVEDDDVWTDIPRATGFHVLGGARKVPKQTWFKMGFTQDALYVAVVCEEPEMAKVADKAKDGGPHVYGDDGVELFVYPAQSKNILQVIANTAGARADYLNEAQGEWHDMAPAPVSRVSAFKGTDFYSIEIEIPFQKLGRSPSDGEIWRGNICRNMVIDGATGPDRASTWARLVRRNLEPDNFAQLVFHDSPPTGKETVIDSQSANKDDAELHLIVDLNFDEGRGDVAHGQSAIINDGKVIGATWTPRGSGYCLTFDKDGDRVEIPHSESLAGIKDAMTLECWAWFDLDKLAGTRGTLISSTPSSGFASGFYLDYVDSGTQTQSICFGVAGGSSSYRNWLYAENVIKTSGWHHVLASYDPKLTDGWRTKIYVDGQRQFLRPTPRNKEVVHRPSGLPLFIGAKPASRAAISEMTATFKGKIDDVKIWDTALTPEDIERMYGSLWAKSSPISPEPSKVITDGKPHLRWSASEDGTHYVIEMATLPDFSGKTVAKEPVAHAHYQVSHALSPGVYYWRVWSTDKAGKPTASCKPRAFVVPFDLDFQAADTTPPAITDVKPPPDTTAENSRPLITARWSDDSGIDVNSARLLLDGKTVTSESEVSTKGVSFTPPADLANGVHTIEVSVNDTAGNPGNRVRQHFAIGEPYRTVVKIDEHRRTTINGEPYFPRILYVRIDNVLAHPWYERLARAGFNAFHFVMPVPAFEVTAKKENRRVEDIHYWTEWELMKRTGLKLYGDIGNYFNPGLLKQLYGSEDLTPSLYEKAARRFAESCAWYDQHTQVLAYKIDEPKGRLGIDRCTAMWKGLSAGGHNRPAFWVLNSPGGAATFGATADGIGIDCYPVSSRPLVQVAKYIDRTHEMLDHKKPVWFVAQSFDWRLLQPPYGPFAKVGKKKDQVLASLPDDFVFTPTPRQIRCMTYLALSHDVQGLLWWSVCWHYKVVSIVDFPEDWKAFLELGGQVRHLSPMLLSTDYVDVGGNHAQLGVHVMAKSHNGRIFIIAVNPNEYLPVAPTFTLPAGASHGRVDVLFEDRSMKLAGDTFQDLFEPLDVHVYRIE